MELDLKGKHVLVTGGSRGIGLACVRGFAAEGARVTLVSKRAESVAAARQQLREAGIAAEGFAADLADAQAAVGVIDQAEAAQGPVDVLVNSAGAARRTPFAELAPQDWHDAMQSKFFSYVHVMDPVAKRMGQRGGGAIVNVVGMGGKIARITHIAGGAANAALMLATAGLAAAYAPRGVRINAVNPGLTLTERLQQGLQADARQRGITMEQALQDAEREQPMGRIARPEEIADAVVWLASARASYVCGAILAMDGAMTPII
jgi:NAD(P)-dependent dehydrogenase (short-subunit alcohol dehydrogenase family)